MEINLRISKTQDFKLLSDMMEDFFNMFEYPFEKEIREKQIAEIMSNPGWGQLFCFEVNTEIAGYLLLSYTYSFEFGGRTGYIDEFYLGEAFRGKGLGKIILRELKSKMEDLNIASIRLEVEKYNTQAIHLYTTEGFNAHDSRFLMTFKP